VQDLVSADWLKGELGKPDLVLFDATYYLPPEGKDARALFDAGHIPGARFFDINEVADPETDLPHMAPTPGRAARLLGQMGVSNDARVVFYDQKGLFSAARGWWLLRLFGHNRVAVLDGGLPKWREAGGNTAAGPAPSPTPQTFWADFVARRLAGIGDVKPAAASMARQPSHALACPPATCPAPATCRRPSCWRPTRPCCRRMRCGRSSPRPASTARSR
jgi:thiosulfate/3-mercaptopyruvate sulfurtransferase